MKIIFLILLFCLTFLVSLHECAKKFPEVKNDRLQLLGAFYGDESFDKKNMEYSYTAPYRPIEINEEKDFFVLAFKRGELTDLKESFFFFQNIVLVTKQSPISWKPDPLTFNSLESIFYFHLFTDGIEYERQLNAYHYIKYNYYNIYHNLNQIQIRHLKGVKTLAPNGRPFDVIKTLYHILNNPIQKINIYRNAGVKSDIIFHIPNLEIRKYLKMNSGDLKRITNEDERRYFQPTEFGQPNPNPPFVSNTDEHKKRNNEGAIIAGVAAGAFAANAAGAAAGIYYAYLKERAKMAKSAGTAIEMTALGIEVEGNANLFNSQEMVDMRNIYGNRPPAGLNAEGESLPRIKEDPFTKGITNDVNNNNYKGAIDDYVNENKVNIEEDFEEDIGDSNNNNYNKDNRQVKDTYYRAQPKVEEYRGDLKRKNIEEPGVTEEQVAPKKPATSQKP